MIDSIMLTLNMLWESFVRVFKYPLDPEQRLFLPYIGTSILLALFVFARRQASDDPAENSGSFLQRLFRFLFPIEIWRHRSTWVDIWYFVPHQMVRIWIHTAAMAIITTAVMRGTLNVMQSMGVDVDAPSVEPGFFTLIAYTFLSILAVDFVSYLVHYLQHKVPLLWQFHKIHHSAEVLNPLSNYREHPVDNVLYASAISATFGVVIALFGGLLHVQPKMIQILEISVFVFAFNTLGYHLRHSHIWLRWPDPLAWVFGCPAHHQIHHSCKPEHINKNMAFIFPIWDILFGTYYLPQKEEELKFGIGDGTESRYRSFWSIYYLPFAELFAPKAEDVSPSAEKPVASSPLKESQSGT